MNIKTNGPVDLCFSNASGLSSDTISTIGQTVGQLGSSAIQRQRQFTEVEQKCGKKPILPGKRRNAWDACAIEYAKSANIPASVLAGPELPAPAQQQKKVPTWAWIVGGVAVLGIVGLVIYKASKK
jgi:phage terminase large subunit-like protein